jgi:general secretion pathway protein C
MRRVPRLIHGVVFAALALTAYLHARGIGALIEASVPTATPVGLAQAAPASLSLDRSADAILDRNPFDHATGPLRAPGPAATDSLAVDDPVRAPPCAGVRALVTVRAHDPNASFAALDVDGKRLLRRRGDSIDAMQLVFVGDDRVWLSSAGALCQAAVFAGAPAGAASNARTAATPAPRGQLESTLEGKIQKSGPHEWQVDRGALDRLLDAQTELMKVPLVPEKEGDRVVGLRLQTVRPNSAVAMLGLEQGDRLVSINGTDVTSPEKMLEAYARLRSGVLDRITLHIVRRGGPLNLDYVVR